MKYYLNLYRKVIRVGGTGGGRYGWTNNKINQYNIVDSIVFSKKIMVAYTVKSKMTHGLLQPFGRLHRAISNQLEYFLFC